MKLKAIAYGIIGAFAISVANAGDYGKEVVPEVTVDNSIGATLSAGYMTDYVFYGGDLGDHGVWTGVDYSLGDFGVPLDIGVWYINPADGTPNDELDLYASYALPSYAGFDSSLNFLAYFFPESGADATYELNLAVSKSLGIVDMDVSAHYDFELEAWYFQTGLSKGFAIADGIELVAGAGIGYSIDYWQPGSKWNHVYVQADLPITLTDTATLTPYVGGIFALDALDELQDDFIHGGVSLSVSF